MSLLSRHLFFEKLKCCDCEMFFNDCQSFYSSYEHKTSICAHRNVEWLNSETPIEFLENKLKHKSKDNRINVYLYVRKLEDLKDRSPWKRVISEIRNCKRSNPMKHSKENTPRVSKLNSSILRDI